MKCSVNKNCNETCIVRYSLKKEIKQYPIQIFDNCKPTLICVFVGMHACMPVNIGLSFTTLKDA